MMADGSVVEMADEKVVTTAGDLVAMLVASMAALRAVAWVV